MSPAQEILLSPVEYSMATLVCKIFCIAKKRGEMLWLWEFEYSMTLKVVWVDDGVCLVVGPTFSYGHLHACVGYLVCAVLKAVLGLGFWRPEAEYLQNGSEKMCLQYVLFV